MRWLRSVALVFASLLAPFSVRDSQAQNWGPWYNVSPGECWGECAPPVVDDSRCRHATACQRREYVIVVNGQLDSTFGDVIVCENCPKCCDDPGPDPCNCSLPPLFCGASVATKSIDKVVELNPRLDSGELAEYGAAHVQATLEAALPCGCVGVCTKACPATAGFCTITATFARVDREVARTATAYHQWRIFGAWANRISNCIPTGESPTCCPVVGAPVLVECGTGTSRVKTDVCAGDACERIVDACGPLCI